MTQSNFSVIDSKVSIINNEGKKLLPKQIGYVEFHYDPSEDDLKQLTYYWTDRELILLAPVKVIDGMVDMAGYDFSIESAEIYVKVKDDALMVTRNREDIQFFKEIFIDSIDCEDFDDEGNFIEEGED